MSLPVQDGDELKAALDHLVETVRRGVPGCDGASLTLLQQGAPRTLAASNDLVRALDDAQYQRSSGPCLTAMDEAREIVVVDFHDEPRWYEMAAEASRAGVRSSLSLPLVDGAGVIGGLNLYAQLRAAFTEESRAAAESFARQAEVLLGYLQQLRNERAARAREHDVSSALQHALLPVLPRLPGVDCAARYHVGSRDAQVGGDWYDVFALPDGAIGLAIGDVMGHDIAAAAAMGQLRSVLRSYAYEGSSPSVVLDRLDRLVQDFEMAQLATAIYGRLLLDPEGATLAFTNAGHLPPLVRTPDGAVSALERAPSPLIGAVPPGAAHRGERVVALPPGSELLLYTDGLVETRERDLDDGMAVLTRSFAATDRGASTDAVCDALLAEMAAGGQDDVAMLLVRIGP
ncbi:MAG: Serine phosphatase RsbU, regulator of sigma subunit [uncultured Quadrisphaera sp.]|uniref:protein-serine/threonine phosphatase n=1 Tax=uncultured Quadrisphaera sp. TaxID=904978 RepID=A0A6J4NV42_9ACTN|nr:MAG: Serine phosphatase RsbU, regulator of sigma subunit [uncultured Quadrisphaera sp.]